MNNIDILNSKPFTDSNLKKTINRLEKETPTITSIEYANFANPSTTEKVLFLSEGQTISQNLYTTVDALVNLTSNISGDQDFTFNLYVGEATAAIATVTIPNALNTLVSFRVSGIVSYSRAVGQNLQYYGSLVITPLTTDETADISSVVVVNNKGGVITYADMNGSYETQLTCTAEVGTATTTITVLGGKVTFDKSN